MIRLKKRQFILSFSGGLALTAAVAFLFYRSAAAMILAVVIVPMYMSRKKKDYINIRKRKLREQFESAMQSVSGALGAGYSMENAWKNAGDDLAGLYGKDAEFYKEMECMGKKLDMNEPLEKLLSDFALRSHDEDICNFAEIFQYAKRSGGNITQIIRETVNRMQEKTAIMNEIENAVAARNSEQKIMNIILPGVLLFITIGSPEYAECLYHNALGITIMSASLVGYFLACMWSEKITDISI